MDRLTKLEVFSKIAETGSFFETARSLNLSRPTVTRLMAELEKDLNQKLLFSELLMRFDLKSQFIF